MAVTYRRATGEVEIVELSKSEDESSVSDVDGRSPASKASGESGCWLVHFLVYSRYIGGIAIMMCDTPFCVSIDPTIGCTWFGWAR